MAQSLATRAQPRRSTRNAKAEANGAAVKKELNGTPIKREPARKPSTKVKHEPPSPSPRKRQHIKTEPAEDPSLPSTPNKKVKKRRENTSSPAVHSPAGDDDKSKALRDRKLKSYSNKSPFPDFPHPTTEECALALRILTSLHGERTRPTEVVAPTDKAGCGNSPSVLDALVRTILSQNTSDRNSSRAKRSMDATYGGSDRWEDIAAGGQAKLQKAIECGGLGGVKSRVILGVLEQAKERHGAYSLDHLFEQQDDAAAMQELISFRGVGPKTASCVLLFCLRRASFAVDTHVHRITGLMGWRPAQGCSRDDTHAHLDARIPDEMKYPLHVLIISHGKSCEECKAGGRSLGKCELRKAFRKGKLKGEAGEDVKHEEEDQVKEEGGEDIKQEVEQ